MNEHYRMSILDKLMSYWISLMALICGVGYAGALVSSLNVRWAMAVRRLVAQMYPVDSMSAGRTGTSPTQTTRDISTMVWAFGLTQRYSSTFTSCTPRSMYYN